MNIAIEKGLHLEKTKLGSGDKEEGYKVEKSRLKGFIVGISVSFLLLLSLAIVYLILYNEQVALSIQQRFQLKEQHGKDKSQSIRMAVALQQAIVEHAESISEANRMLKRIDNVIDNNFENLIKEVSKANSIPQGELVSKLADAKQKITAYVNQEIEDFSKDAKDTSSQNKIRLQKIAKIQEESLRGLLTSVSGIKLDALEDMLDDLFDAVHKSIPLSIDSDDIAEIDNIADKLYEQSMTKEDGKKAFGELQKRITDLPELFTNQIKNAQTAYELGNILDQISEAAKLSSGREELAAIEKKWREDMEKFDKTKEFEEDEIQCTVDAMLKVQQLVSAGKVPVHLLDFEALDLDGKFP